MIISLLFLFPLVIDFQFEQKSSELSNVNQPVIANATVDDKFGLFLAHAVTFKTFSRFGYVQFSTSVFIEFLELFDHFLGAKTAKLGQREMRQPKPTRRLITGSKIAAFNRSIHHP